MLGTTLSAGDYLSRVCQEIERLDVRAIVNVSEVIERAYDAGKFVFIIGNGGSGAASREEQHIVLLERGADRVSPFAIPLSVANMGAGQVSMELGLHGPVTAVCTACAAGTDAIGAAVDILRRGAARAMLAGGSDALVTPYFVAGFDAMRVLSHRNDDPAGAARSQQEVQPPELAREYIL